MIKYKEWISDENLLKLEAWARDGLTEIEIAKNIGITTVTLWDWKKKHACVLNALKKGKEVADIIIENALFKRATGYEAVEERAEYGMIDGQLVEVKRTKTTRHIPADTTAQIFYLKNRKPRVWKDRVVDEDNSASELVDKLKNFEIEIVDGRLDEKNRSN